MGTKLSSVRNMLRKNGYSEETIEEIFKWYGLSIKQNPESKKTQKINEKPV